MNSDTSSSNIALLVYTITPYRRRLSMTIIDRRRRRERQKKRRTRRRHLLHHIDLNDDHRHHEFLICPQRTWWAYCHLVTPLVYIFKMSLRWICTKRLRDRERISLFYLDLTRDLSDIFLLLLLSSSLSYSYRASYYVNE